MKLILIKDSFLKVIMVKKILVLLVAVWAMGFASYSQNWTLQKCVEVARQNSLALKQNQILIERNRIALIQSQQNLYPNLSSNLNYRINFGRTIDPTTNDFENQSISQNSLGLSTGMILYNGGALKNSISQSKVNVETAQLDAEQFSNDLALTVVQFYIAILFAEERLDNARIQLQTTTEQLNQVDRLITAGARPEGDRLEILAQQARDEQAIITNQNTVNANKLGLKQLLRLPTEEAFEIQRPAPDAIQPSFIEENLNAIYNYALDHRADMKSGDLKIKSSEMGVKIQKANYVPTVTLGGSLSSLYSSLGRRITGTQTVKSPVTVEFNGQQTTLGIFNESPVFGKNPYFKQLDQNLGYGIGAGVSIPIYNNYRARGLVRNAELTVEASKISFEQSKQTLRNNIQTALNDYEAAKRTYEASRRTAAASQLAYNNMKAKYDLGSANTFELVSTKNRWDIAKVEEILGRYELIFRSKVIDYYLGRPVNLN
jgi:outer membrane protein